MTSREVAKATGVTLRQLQWWDERRIIPVSQQHHCRSYTAEDRWKIKVLADLRKRGLSLLVLRKLLKQMAPGKGFLVTDGKQVHQANSLQFAALAALKFKRPVFVVETPGL